VTPAAAPRARLGYAALALALGVAFVTLYDASLGVSHYPYSGDSASYIEMAASLHADGHPRVTPWGLEHAEQDAVPQPLFPPGFAVLASMLIPLAGDARAAAAWPSRVGAALLPLLIVLCWRGTLPPGALLLVGAWALLSPGVRTWQFIAYSDVAALALAVFALGLLARAVHDAAEGRPPGLRRWVGAGAAVAACYAMRNAGLAVLAASFATLAYLRVREFIGTRAILAWLAGAALPIVVLETYNLATFHSLWPYSMPASVRGWADNTLDYSGAQLEDLGLPPALVADGPPGVWLVLLLLALAAGAAVLWASRARRGAHAVLALLACYAGAGALLLIASRSRFEWGNLIDSRNVLQYSFAFGLAAAVAVATLAPPWPRRASAALLGLLVVVQAVAALGEAREAREAAPESWLALDRDADLMGAARAIPSATLVASNAAVLFRIGVPLRARQLDVGGEDRDFEGSLTLLRRAAGARAAAFLLVCNEWTWQFSACAGPATGAAPKCMRLRSAAPIVALCEAGASPAASGPSSGPDA
jgi:hypothetical protein